MGANLKASKETLHDHLHTAGNRTIRRDFILSLLVTCAIAPSSNAAEGKRLGVVLVVGDSISAEYGLKRGSGWVALLEQRLKAQSKNITVVNASISGDTTSAGLARLPPLLERHHPNVVILELGGNDALRGLPLEMTRQNLLRMTQLARQAGAQVLLLGMQVPPNYGADYTRQFAQTFELVAKETRSALVPFLLKDIADRNDAAQWFQADRIHPNEQAQPHIVNNVWPSLLRLIK